MKYRAMGVGLLVASSFAVLLAMNLRPFVSAKPEIRVGDLNFLPSPEVAKVLAFGHDNSVARLRWIDSFSYLQLQFDRRDDSVAGGGSGFSRLYGNLLALDEHFIPVYQQAALCIGGIAGRPGEALGILMRGILANPDDFTLWQHAASMMVVDFNIEEVNPGAFDDFLGAWASQMTDEGYRNGVWQWQASLARRRFQGLEQLPYWLDRLRTTTDSSPLAIYIEKIIRTQLATYAVSKLNQVRESRLDAGLPCSNIQELLDPERLNAAKISVRWGPIVSQSSNLALRSDPWGWPYQIEDGKVVSPGLRIDRFQNWLDNLNKHFPELAAKHGKWPDSLEEAYSWLEFPLYPIEGARMEWTGKQILYFTANPPDQPYDLRSLESVTAAIPEP
jgi:hypothetical protein